MHQYIIQWRYTKGLGRLAYIKFDDPTIQIDEHLVW